jgi:hypothetical protein
MVKSQNEDDHLLEISKVVMTTLNEHFRSVKVIDVKTSVEKDSEGDSLLRIAVIFEGEPRDIDAKEFSGAVRFVRPKLSDIAENRFPLFSFISKREIGDRSLGTA